MNRPRPDDSVTTRGPSRSSMSGRQCFVTTVGPRRFTASVRSRSSVEASCSGPASGKIPALFTSTSRPPISSRIRSVAAAISSSSVTSSLTARWSSAVTSLVSRAPAYTVAPRSVRSAAICSPIPRVAPVTSATCPSSDSCRSTLDSVIPPLADLV